MRTREFLSHLKSVKKNGAGWSARCPAHEDDRASLSIGEGDDGKILLHCHAGCSTEEVISTLDLSINDLFPDSPRPERRIVATYDYTDESGALLFQVVRFDPKDFRGRRPDGRGGWTWNMKDTKRGLYRLPELQKAERVFIVEGEKDVESLRKLGLVASCNPGGAGKWRPEFSESLRDKDVIILPDNDGAGRNHAEQVAGSLRGIAKAIKVVTLPGLPPKGDLSDYLTSGGTREGLLELIEKAVEWKEESRSERAGLVSLSDVKPEPVGWLWKGRVPLKKITVADGDPGLGKSLLSLDIAARVTGGRAMPDGSPTDPGGVVILTAEDGLSDTVRPRLELAGADLSKVVALQSVRDAEGKPRPPTVEDCEAIREAIQKVSAHLIVIDPLMCYVPEKRNSHRDQDIRRSLLLLATLAEETGAAVLIIRHLNKSGGSQSIYRGGGSIGIIGAARSGLLIAKDPDDENRRVLAGVKSNLAPLAPSLRFHLEDVSGVPRIVWDGQSTHGADALLAAATPGGESAEDTSALGEAKSFIVQILAAGPVLSAEVFKQGREAGISEATLRRAKALLGVKAQKSAIDGKWSWFLPLKDEPVEDAQEGDQPSSLEQVEHLERLQENQELKGQKQESFFEDAQDAQRVGNGAEDEPIPLNLKVNE